MIRTRLTLASLGAALGILASTAPGSAQDLEPKAYSASPVGAAFLVVGFARSTGSVLFDPTLPITDVEAKSTARCSPRATPSAWVASWRW